MALQAISVRENVHCKFRRGDPEAPVRHRGEPNGKAASTTSYIILCFLLLCRRLQASLFGNRVPGSLRFHLLLLLLLFQAMDAFSHGLEQRRQGLHGFALILRDVIVHRGSLPKSTRERADDDLVFPRQTRGVREPCRRLP